MKRYWIYVIFLLFASSCAQYDYEVKIHWVTLYDTASDDFKRTRVTLDFANGEKDKTFRITPYKTEKIRLDDDMRLSGSGGEYLYMMHIYPDNYANGINSKPEDRFKTHGAMEIYLYNPWIINQTESGVTMPPHEKVLAYHYSFSQNNELHQIFSKNNLIKTDVDTITEIPSGVSSLEDILNFMEENNVDTCYYSLIYASPTTPADYWDDFTAYVVRSGLDKKPLLLPSFDL